MAGVDDYIFRHPLDESFIVEYAFFQIPAALAGVMQLDRVTAQYVIFSPVIVDQRAWGVARKFDNFEFYSSKIDQIPVIDVLESYAFVVQILFFTVLLDFPVVFTEYAQVT